MRSLGHAGLLAVVAVALGTAACTSSDPRELDSGELHALIQRGLEQADQDNALHFTEDEADCVADRVMEDISDDRLKDLGVDEGFGLSTLDFTPAEQDVVFAALSGCVDLVAQVADTLATDSGLDGEQARCLAEGYAADDAFREAIFSERFDPALNDRIDTALADAARTCGLAPPG
jgi:hypothetical protein